MHKGQNFHYEVTNRYLMVAFQEIFKYHNFKYHKDILEKLKIGNLLDNLKEVMEFKMQNGTLDLKTYLRIVESYLSCI